MLGFAKLLLALGSHLTLKKVKKNISLSTLKSSVPVDDKYVLADQRVFNSSQTNELPSE